MINAIKHSIYTTYCIDRDCKEAKKYLNNYKIKYSQKCSVNGVSKYKMLATLIQMMLIMMLLEKMIECRVEFRRINWITGLTEYTGGFPLCCKNVSVPDFRLEHIFSICDFIGTTLSDVKKIVLKNILIKNEEQNDKKVIYN